MAYLIDGYGYEPIQCGDCGIIFLVPEIWVRTRKQTHEPFTCPNGHARVYKGESDIERAQREAHEAQARINQEAHLREVAERAKLRAEAELKRLKARHDAGVCLHCNRTFNNLARHIQTKHPAQIEGGKTRKQIAPPLVN